MRRKRPNNHAGYTLLETMVSASIAALLLLGGTDLFLSSVRVSSRSDAQVSATARATVIIAQIIDMSRECYAVSLPTDPVSSGFCQYMNWHPPADFITRDGQAACVQLTTPGTAAITVNDSSGSAQTAGTNFAMTYANTAGQTFWIYRSDAYGNPRPDNGQYLWEYGPLPGMPAYAYNSRVFARLGETAAVSAAIPDEATFVHPATAIASAPAVEIHLIAADYSAINGGQSSESATNQIVGKCVMLRNHP